MLYLAILIQNWFQNHFWENNKKISCTIVKNCLFFKYFPIKPWKYNCASILLYNCIFLYIQVLFWIRYHRNIKKLQGYRNTWSKIRLNFWKIKYGGGWSGEYEGSASNIKKLRTMARTHDNAQHPVQSGHKDRAVVLHFKWRFHFLNGLSDTLGRTVSIGRHPPSRYVSAHDVPS